MSGPFESVVVTYCEIKHHFAMHSIYIYFLLKIIFATPESTEYRVTTSKDVSPKFVTIREQLGIFVDASLFSKQAMHI